MQEQGKQSSRPLDLFGSELAVGDFVIGGSGHLLSVYKVLNLTPKMVRIVSVTSKRPGDKGKLRYAKELARIDGQLATFYILRHS